ncbi:hypothetical protein AX17_005153 [Amanita inopinata Kibby_2008]|nr:hypothetical protein AX17_005153 [Amanita inopinata Kibby_2008]
MSSASSPTIPSSKRHSLNIHTGQRRPLQLVDGAPSIPSTPPSINGNDRYPSSRPTSAPLLSGFPAIITADHKQPSPSLSIILNEPRSSASRPGSKRQSSISYKRSSYDHSNTAPTSAQTPFETDVDLSAHGRALTRPNSHAIRPRPMSMVYPPSTPPSNRASDRRSMGSVNSIERPPLTLTEKHADLLRFIAQKESKCLELRSQLAMHEAELLQLKRKWERIVSRGFEHSLSSTTPNTPSTSPSNQPSPPSHTSAHTPATPGGTVLEGIKESVQGVSRLIAAGLSIANDHSYNNHSHSHSQTHHSSPRPSPHFNPHSHSQSQPHSRSTNLSTSSVSTSYTKSSKSSSVRYSASSASSFEVEPTELETGNGGLQLAGPSSGGSGSGSDSELIVRDTGATPTMSPNPKFRRKRKDPETKVSQRSLGVEAGSQTGLFDVVALGEGSCVENTGVPVGSRAGTTEVETGPGIETGTTWVGSSSAIEETSSKCHRRKSRDVSMEDIEHLRRSPSPTETSVNAEKTKVKRMSLGMMSSVLAPVSSIPGLGSLTAVASSGLEIGSSELVSTEDRSASTNTSPSTWVGKKWESLHKGATLSKSQKRASLLLSDVSQTLASAWSSLPTSSTSTLTTSSPSTLSPSLMSLPSLSSGTSTGTASSSSSSLPTPLDPTRASLLSFSPLNAANKPAPVSLLDQDDNDDLFFNVQVGKVGEGKVEVIEGGGGGGGLGLMQPMKPQLLPLQPTKPMVVVPPVHVQDGVDEEWNW